MDIDEKGRLYNHRIAETVIRVDERMTYTAVNEILTGQNEETSRRYEAFVPMFQLMGELSGILREKKKKARLHRL
jgi:ribonuclease R